MATTSMLLAVLAGVAHIIGQASSDVVAFVGTGNCDTADKDCVEGPSAPEQVIRPLLIKQDGSMSVLSDESLSIPTSGMPVWLTTVGQDIHSGCIFATLADKSMIFSHGSGGTHTVPSGGSTPVFASVTEDGRTLLVANYHAPDNANTSAGASVASFAIGEQCSLSLVDVRNHSGSSVVPTRQGGAHVHSAVAARGGVAFACDLGMDKIFTYAVDHDGKLTEKHRTAVKPGSGPRHLVQHPVLPYVYVVNEIAVSVAAYKQHADGSLEELQIESLVHSDFRNQTGSKAAEIAISPDGSLIFATNRGGQNTVTAFKTLSNGSLTRTGFAEAPSFPRGMALVEEGAILLVAGQTKTEVWSYSVGEDGSLKRVSELHASGHTVDLPPHPATFTTFQAYSPQERALIVTHAMMI